MMKTPAVLAALLLTICGFAGSSAQTLPLVYDVENTGADCPKPPLPSFSQLPVIGPLPDPFAWADGRGRMSYYSDWRIRRAEIGAQIQAYEIGEKPPRPDSITAGYSGGVLTVQVAPPSVDVERPIARPSQTSRSVEKFGHAATTFTEKAVVVPAAASQPVSQTITPAELLK